MAAGDISRANDAYEQLGPDGQWQQSAARGGFPTTEIANDGTTNHWVIFKPGDSLYERVAPYLQQTPGGQMGLQSNALTQVIPEIGQYDLMTTLGPSVAMALMGGTALSGAGGGVGAEAVGAGASGGGALPESYWSMMAEGGAPATDAAAANAGTVGAQNGAGGNMFFDNWDLMPGATGEPVMDPTVMSNPGYVANYAGAATMPPQLQQILKLAQTLVGSGGGGGGGQAPGGGGAGVDNGLAGLLTGLYSLLANKPDPARSNELWGAGRDVFNLARDPQNALHDRTQQQVVEGARAGQTARGVAMSPYGAGLEGDAIRNFNIDWQNNLLGRSVSGLNSFTNAGSTALGQNNVDRAFDTAQTTAGTNAFLGGAQNAVKPGGWLEELWKTASNAGTGYDYGLAYGG